VKSTNFTWLAGLKYVLQFLKEGWRCIIYFCLTELFWGSGFGLMLMREGPYGGWLWVLNTAACRVGGVIMRSKGRMGWGFGKISGGARESFLAKLELRWVMARKLDSGLTCAVGIKPSRSLFHTCSVWPDLRKLSWQTIWISLVSLISGMLTFLEQVPIGWWISLPRSPICCIP
jgi:hypothetical protein